MDSRVEKGFATIESLQINIESGIRSSNSDLEYIKLLQQGTAEKDYKKVYKFVDSVERGCGFYNDSIEVSDAIISTLDRDEDRLISILNQKERLIDIVFIISCIKLEDKIKLVQNPCITDPLVQYEFIRQILNDRPNELLSEDSVNSITKGVVHLSSMDIEIFKYLIKQFEFKQSFSLAIGTSLNFLSNEALKAVAETITIDKYKLNLNNANSMIKCMKEENLENIIGNIREVVCKRWANLLKKIKDEEPILNSIIISSYANLILMCLLEEYQERTIFFEELNEILVKFENDLFSWKPNVSKACTIYFVNATQLFFMKLVRENNGFLWYGQENIKLKIEILFNNDILHCHYWEKNIKEDEYSIDTIKNWY